MTLPLGVWWLSYLGHFGWSLAVCAHIHAGKTSRLFPRALCAGEITRGFSVDIFGKSGLRSKGFRGNPVSTNLIGD